MPTVVLPKPRVVSANPAEARARLELAKEFDRQSTSGLTAFVSMLVTSSSDALASQHTPAKCATEICGSAANFFPSQQGIELVATASVVNKDSGGLVSRCQVHRMATPADDSERQLIAEVTQSYRYVDGAESDAIATPSPTVIESTVTPFKTQAGKKTTKTSQQRLRQIFDAACEVIGQKGYGNASIRDIAREANMSIASIYQYVDNKEDILWLITSTCMESIFDFFEHKLEPNQDPSLALRSAIDAYIDYINSNRRYINLVYSETRALSPGNRQKVFQKERQFMKLWEAILIRGKEQGVFDIDNTDLYANFIYFACTVWSLRFWSIGHHDEQSVREELTNLIMNGVLAN